MPQSLRLVADPDPQLYVHYNIIKFMTLYRFRGSVIFSFLSM